MSPSNQAGRPSPHLQADLRLDAALAESPIIAILRGLRSDEALSIVQALYDAGIRVAEVPLNSPTPFDTIRLLANHFGERMVIGAGTVTKLPQVAQLAACGALLCVSPNTDPAIIAEAKRLGLVPLPGFQTATDAFAAMAAGARHLKLFPAAGRAEDLAAMLAVFPREVKVLAVGGNTPQTVSTMLAAGASGFGVGSDLFRPGATAADVLLRAQAWVTSCRSAHQAPTVSLVCNPRALIGKAPLWRASRQRIIWVDPVQRQLISADETDRIAAGLALAAAVYSIDAMPGGQLAGALEDGFCLIDEENGALQRGPAAQLDAGCRFNDMTVDTTGGLWVGAMHKGLLATRGALYYAPAVDAPCRQIAAGLGVPNGMAFDPTGRTLYVIDTLARTLLAYPADVANGTLGEPVVVTDFMGMAGKPDGMTIGPDGSLWVAMWGGASVVKIAASGSLLQAIKLPAPHVSSACFDADGRLWVSTSRMRLSEQELMQAPGSGALFMIRL